MVKFKKEIALCFDLFRMGAMQRQIGDEPREHEPSKATGTPIGWQIQENKEKYKTIKEPLRSALDLLKSSEHRQKILKDLHKARDAFEKAIQEDSKDRELKDGLKDLDLIINEILNMGGQGMQTVDRLQKTLDKLENQKGK
jgi:hypothetical protein